MKQHGRSSTWHSRTMVIIVRQVGDNTRPMSFAPSEIALLVDRHHCSESVDNSLSSLFVAIN